MTANIAFRIRRASTQLAFPFSASLARARNRSVETTLRKKDAPM
jgi:hypothetical protein